MINYGSSACILLPVLQKMYEAYVQETSYEGRGFLLRLRLLTDAEGQIVGMSGAWSGVGSSAGLLRGE
jgi:hypothetical protein